MRKDFLVENNLVVAFKNNLYTFTLFENLEDLKEHALCAYWRPKARELSYDLTMVKKIICYFSTKPNFLGLNPYIAKKTDFEPNGEGPCFLKLEN